MAKKKKGVQGWKAAPLKGSFMVFGMLGFLISAYLVYTRSQSYGIAFMLIFALMFIASLISMSKAPVGHKEY
jgi:predicted membrane protein